MSARISIPCKDFSLRDPNRGHGISCVVVMISASDEEEALRFMATHPDKLTKYPLRLPSDVGKFPALAQFLRSEEGLNWDVGVQTEAEQEHQEDEEEEFDPSEPDSEPDAKVKEEVDDEEESVVDARIHNTLNTSMNEDHENPRRMPVRLSMNEEQMSDITSEEIDVKREERGYESDVSIRYLPPKKRRKYAKKANKGSKSDTFECTICSSNIIMRNSSLQFLMKHAMTHCADQKRFKCSECSYTTSFNCELSRHSHMASRTKGARGIPIDRKNALREALWKYLMYKCFPDIDRVVTRQTKPMRSTVCHYQCHYCEEEILATDHDMFEHIVGEHTHARLDYDDPRGVLKRFFGAQAVVEEDQSSDVFGDTSAVDSDSKVKEEVEEPIDDNINSVVVKRPRRMTVQLRVKEEEMSDITSEENDDKMEEGNRSDDSVRYVRRKTKRKSVKKTPKGFGDGASDTFECVMCSAHIVMRKSSISFLAKHAMTHCEEKRFKCSQCPVSTSFLCEMARHPHFKAKTGIPIDRKNGLREALWKHLLYKCFPSVNNYVTPRKLKKSTVLQSQCRVCSEEILGDAQDLYAHMLADHSDRNDFFDFNDPRGTMGRFFGAETVDAFEPSAFDSEDMKGLKERYNVVKQEMDDSVADGMGMDASLIEEDEQPRFRSIKEEMRSDSEYEDDVKKEVNESDDDYRPNKTFQRGKSMGRSSGRHGVNKKFDCTVCSAKITMRVSSLTYLMNHALTHAGEHKRFKCSRCDHSASNNGDVLRHLEVRHNGRGTSIDRKNGLREAMWKELVYKCFPDIDQFVTPRKPKNKPTGHHSRCIACSEVILADDQDLFAHILKEHNDDSLDYDDAQGVKRRFFVD